MKNLLEMKESLCACLKDRTALENPELISEVVLSLMCEVFSGDNVYIPNRKIDSKKQAIIKKFNGNNHHQLALEFGYTARHVYRMLSNEKSKQLQL
ncbi:MAG: Mor transcription activator family protein [Methylococcales bacterium]|nr:Mor transcription activator family protein [Methylococcales bacterium]